MGLQQLESGGTGFKVRFRFSLSDGMFMKFARE